MISEFACIGVTLWFFRWRMFVDFEDKHYCCQIGPIAIDLYVGDEEL